MSVDNRPRIQGNCANCGVDIEVFPWRKVNFCSNRCKMQEKRAREAGTRARCQSCGVSFEKTPTSNYVNCPSCRAKGAALQEREKG